MYFLFLIVPFVISIIILSMYKNYSIPGNMKSAILSVPTGVCAFIMIFMTLCMQQCNCEDVEYLHYYITNVQYEEPWNERVAVKKTKHVRGENGQMKEITYTDYEIRNHPAKYFATLNTDKDISITKHEYDSIRNMWNVPSIFIDKHRHYYTKDGDAYRYDWDNNLNTLKPYTKEHTYTNKIIGSESTFKFNEISESDARELGLYDYPKIINGEQNPIIGYTKYIHKNDITSIKRFNALYGYDKQISLYVLIYPYNVGASIVEDQRSYWQGGNKNEFVICCGIDTLTNKVKWSQCFSWQDDITLDINTRTYINSMNTFNIPALVSYIENNVDLWHRKEFKDFSYIDVPISNKQITSIIICCCIVMFVLFSYIAITISDYPKRR